MEKRAQKDGHARRFPMWLAPSKIRCRVWPLRSLTHSLWATLKAAERGKMAKRKRRRSDSFDPTHWRSRQQRSGHLDAAQDAVSNYCAQMDGPLRLSIVVTSRWTLVYTYLLQLYYKESACLPCEHSAACYRVRHPTYSMSHSHDAHVQSAGRPSAVCQSYNSVSHSVTLCRRREA